MNPDEVRAVLQRLINEDNEGWTVGQIVVVMALERINADGTVDSTPWYWAPANQADWMTGGLLEAAHDLRACAESDE